MQMSKELIRNGRPKYLSQTHSTNIRPKPVAESGLCYIRACLISFCEHNCT